MKALLQVMESKCDQCLFSKNRIVSAVRVQDIIQTCREKDNYFICHKTENIVCRGFYNSESCNAIRIAGRLKSIEFVKEEDL